MDDSYPFHSMSIGCPIPDIRLFKTLTLKLQGQGLGYGQRARSYSQLSICFLFTSHQSDQQFLRYSYFKILPWNIQGQGHKWGQRSMSHIIPSIQPTHFLFISHQLDQPFLRYGQNSFWPWKNKSKITTYLREQWVNSLRLKQHGHHFPDIFKCIFLNENEWISIKISLKSVSKGPINNIPALVQIMAWHWPGDKPLSEPMMVSLPMHHSASLS